MAVQNFTPIRAKGWERGPHMAKFPSFGKESPRRGEHFHRFLHLLGAFIRPTILHCFTFDAIRLTGYGLIAEKPRDCHLPRFFSVRPVGKLCVGSKHDSHLFNDLDVLYHLVKFVEDRTTRAGCRCENMVFVCLLRADQHQQMTIIAKEEKSDNNNKKLS